MTKEQSMLNAAVNTLAEYAKRHLSNDCRIELVFDASAGEVTLELFDSVGDMVEFDSQDSGFESACMVSKELSFTFQRDKDAET